MFYYLLAKNVNILKNMEQVASITVIKYISFIAFLKLIEYKYLEPGFLNAYIVALILFDILFSLAYHYKVSMAEDQKIFWDDDVYNSDFSLNKYRKEFEECKEEIGKRENTYTTVQKPFKLTESIDDNDSDSVLNTCELEGAINKIISDSKGSKHIDEEQVEEQVDTVDKKTNIID